MKKRTKKRGLGAMKPFKFVWGASTGVAGTKSKRKRGLRGSDYHVRTDANELILFIENDGDLYRQMHQPIQKNLCRKVKKGTFDRTKSVKAFQHLADRGAKKYACEFDQCSRWNKIFNVADRKQVAQWLSTAFVGDAPHMCKAYGLAGVKRRVRRKR